MPVTRRSSDSAEGRKRRSSSRSSLEDGSPKAKKEPRRGSRSSLRMQNKISGVTLPDLKNDDIDLSPRKERTPKKKTEVEEEEEVFEQQQEAAEVAEETVASNEETAPDPEDENAITEETENHVEESAEAAAPVEGEEPCEETPEEEAVEKPLEMTEQDTVAEPSPVISGETGPVHVPALA